MAKGYSINPDPDRTAKALGKDLHIKPKDAINVATFLRGKDIKRAKDDLCSVLMGAGERPPLPDDAEEASRILRLPRKAVPYRVHYRSRGHKRGMGPGAYPVKASKAFLKLLEQAEANAEYKGLDPTKLVVEHVAAQKARVIPGMMPRARGRGSPWNTQLTHVEIVVGEKEEA